MGSRLSAVETRHCAPPLDEAVAGVAAGFFVAGAAAGFFAAGAVVAGADCFSEAFVIAVAGVCGTGAVLATAGDGFACVGEAFAGAVVVGCIVTPLVMPVTPVGAPAGAAVPG